MTATIDSILHAAWIIPVEPHGVFLENHAIVISEGKILDLLPSKIAEEKYKHNHTEQLKTHVLIPGLVNAHAHSPMVLFRGLADDLPLMTWLTEHIWPAEATYLSEALMRDGTELAIAEMLRGGTTCFNEHYFYPEVTAQTAMDCGMRACVGLWLGEVKTPWAQDVDTCLKKGMAALNAFNLPSFQHANRHLLSFSLAPHSPYMLNDGHMLEMKALSEEHDLAIYMHLHETQDEIKTSLEQYKQRPIQRLHRLGLLSHKFQAVHMVQSTAEDIQLLHETNTHVINCPESNLKLASGFCPVHALISAGVNVALGTDGAASNNDLDMFTEMRSSALLAKAVANDPTAISAATVLRMATLNGAKAMGLDRQIGSLEIGKAADLVAVNLAEINTQPIYNPISQLIYAANSYQVSDVWIAGKPVLRNKELVTMNKEALLEKAQQWRAKIRQFC